ncbi:sorting nexin-2-like [Styela clava]|uniref:sorting nexin-2-like n=1 Tax=Styela clava TaxID=7725 RepID=UPI00193A0D1A|nr:sorting nexin-2-like [Styela clava]
MSDSREPPPDDDDLYDLDEKDDMFTSTKETPQEEIDLNDEKEDSAPPVDVDTDKKFQLVDNSGDAPQKKEDEHLTQEVSKPEEEDDDLFKDADTAEMSDVTLDKTPESPEPKPMETKPEKPKVEVKEVKEEIKKEEKVEDKDDMFDLEEDKDKVHDLNISVSEPHKKGEGMNAYMTYKVKTKTTMPMFKRPELVVDRRFSDFLGLHEKLVAKHRHVGRIVPPAPEKSLVGMTRVKMSKTEEEAQAIDFIERRRAALERYLNRLGRHTVLLQDPDFRDFLEQDELPQATSTRALSGAGMMRLMKNVEGAISKITIRMTEDDVWFEEKQQQIESLDNKLRMLHSAVEDLVRHRKELASNTASFAKSAATLGNSEEHTALSRALAQLSEAFEKVEGLHQEVANSDYYNVAEVIGDYIRIIGEIKEVFQIRVKSWHNWQTAEQNLAKKKELESKLQQQGRNDKLPNVQSEIKELESRVKTCKQEFDDLSTTIKKEIMKFEQNRVMDFKQIILVFLKMLMKSQEQNIKFWEGFLPEARAIA